jgi:hypothetical protein
MDCLSQSWCFTEFCFFNVMADIIEGSQRCKGSFCQEQKKTAASSCTKESLVQTRKLKQTSHGVQWKQEKCNHHLPKMTNTNSTVSNSHYHVTGNLYDRLPQCHMICEPGVHRVHCCILNPHCVQIQETSAAACPQWVATGGTLCMGCSIWLLPFSMWMQYVLPESNSGKDHPGPKSALVHQILHLAVCVASVHSMHVCSSRSCGHQKCP